MIGAMIFVVVVMDGERSVEVRRWLGVGVS